jgi:hypothetical protein
VITPLRLFNVDTTTAYLLSKLLVEVPLTIVQMMVQWLLAYFMMDLQVHCCYQCSYQSGQYVVPVGVRSGTDSLAVLLFPCNLLGCMLVCCFAP